MKLTNNRITLRPIGMADALEIQQGASDKSVARNMFMPYPFRIEDARKLITKSQRERRAGKAIVFGIIVRDTDKLVGLAGLYHINKSSSTAELAYWINRKFRGNGYAFAASKLAVKYAFKTLKLRKLTAGTLADNPISAKVLKKTGFTKEAHMRKHAKVSGKWIDICYFGLFKNEVA